MCLFTPSGGNTHCDDVVSRKLALQRILMSILKLKNTVLAKIPENQEKIGLENVILKGKIEIIEKILKETKEIVEKTEVISSARFFSNWKNVNKDQKAAFSFLKVFF